MNIEPIAFFHSPYPTKFGIPRQSGIIADVPGSIRLVGDFACQEALRGLDDYDYLWLIWGFSEHVGAAKHPTVRPPLLGGNERVGVWATRSPFRPNNLGLSSVRLVSVDAQRGVIDVVGADLMDGTPIYDIKPYLAYVDSHADARGGFTDHRQWQSLRVAIPDALHRQLTREEEKLLRDTLALDPRPHYHADDDRQYVLTLMGREYRFQVVGDEVRVIF